MSRCAFEDLGEGRFSISGELGFETADHLLTQSKDLFADYSTITIDFSGVTSTLYASFEKAWCDVGLVSPPGIRFLLST